MTSGPTPDLGRLKGLRMLVIPPFNCRGRHSDADVGGCPELRFLSSEGHTTEAAFKTPGLRGVATRAPYMHAGQIQSLADVIEHYATAPVALVGHSELRPLELSTGEKVALLAFLNTLGPEP